jgi:hypothetical protein
MMMDVMEATRGYEAWMRRCTTVVEGHLRKKHEQMCRDQFSFCRASYYRWAQLFPDTCRALARAPRVFAVGDLHVESFGTWRDLEGRLCWGVDDFDEAFTLPYTNDLVRLAASAKMVIDDERLVVKFKDACDAILEGYRKTLRDGGRPVVLGEEDTNLAALGVDALEAPEDFWPTLQALPTVRHVPTGVMQILRRALPDAPLELRVVRREAGIGSLGQQRFVAIAVWQGGCIAREAKAMLPSACVWLARREPCGPSWSARTMDGAVRSRDPFHAITKSWLVRRLSPDSNPIEIADLPKERTEETLLYAMGREAANVHLGSRRRVGAVLADLRRRKGNWLRVAAKHMEEATRRDWRQFRKEAR